MSENGKYYSSWCKIEERKSTEIPNEDGWGLCEDCTIEFIKRGGLLWDIPDRYSIKIYVKSFTKIIARHKCRDFLVGYVKNPQLIQKNTR